MWVLGIDNDIQIPTNVMVVVVEIQSRDINRTYDFVGYVANELHMSLLVVLSKSMAILMLLCI